MAWRWEADSGRHRPDAGFTLAEALVSMGLMSVAMVIFTAGFVRLYATTHRAEAGALAQNQVHAAVERLAREVRYAAGISRPLQLTASMLSSMPAGQGLQAGDWYVEYSTIAYSGPPMCVQLRLLTGARHLQRRAWENGRVPAGGWSVLANDVTVPPSGGAPFAVLPVGTDDVGHQRLAVDLSVAAGSVAQRRTALTFVAMNTSLDSTGDTVCTVGRGAA